MGTQQESGDFLGMSNVMSAENLAEQIRSGARTKAQRKSQVRGVQQSVEGYDS